MGAGGNEGPSCAWMLLVVNTPVSKIAVILNIWIVLNDSLNVLLRMCCSASPYVLEFDFWNVHSLSWVMLYCNQTIA